MFCAVVTEKTEEKEEEGGEGLGSGSKTAGIDSDSYPGASDPDRFQKLHQRALNHMNQVHLHVHVSHANVIIDCCY